MINLTIPGNPVGKQRARVTRQGHAFTPVKTVNYETLIRELFAVQYPNHAPWSGSIEISIKAFFLIPKSVSKKRRAEMETESVRYPHKSDWDNIGKIVSDGLKGLAYDDDCLITNGHVEKRYSPRPRVEIELEELT